MDNPTIFQLICLRYNHMANTEFLAMVDRIIETHSNVSHKPLSSTEDKAGIVFWPYANIP